VEVALYIDQGADRQRDKHLHADPSVVEIDDLGRQRARVRRFTSVNLPERISSPMTMIAAVGMGE
jgi:hypothetical protein